MEDIIQPYPLYGFWHSWWYEHYYFLIKVFVCFFIALFIIALLWLLWKRRKRSIVPAWSNAVQTLHNNVHSYDDIWCIMRNYLMVRYDIVLVGLTEQELADHLSQHDQTTADFLKQFELLAYFLQAQRFSANVTDTNKLLYARTMAVELIQKTIPS